MLQNSPPDYKTKKNTGHRVPGNTSPLASFKISNLAHEKKETPIAFDKFWQEAEGGAGQGQRDTVTHVHHVLASERGQPRVRPLNLPSLPRRAIIFPGSDSTGSSFILL